MVLYRLRAWETVFAMQPFCPEEEANKCGRRRACRAIYHSGSVYSITLQEKLQIATFILCGELLADAKYPEYFMNEGAGVHMMQCGG